ncbi:hypothetical protein EIN_161420 [Entamoeba invadens IP1]|uniref:Uncharacterized protein n=1 Tax=Entamoeba invadens IP1 TaxID=370355 RepID=A0A0A1TYJ8_ENTIV|nr:hypothetical protein EIN_161420 [Entamoeba invadens IP1]ELP86548.1 hypothetical protein EIN_161420 [Entamoeba invadens IP1]|eukprot:XP_004185894.1 hypothetical protein EIN_161420 [Entamoeba invadens IP1]
MRLNLNGLADTLNKLDSGIKNSFDKKTVPVDNTLSLDDQMNILNSNLAITNDQMASYEKYSGCCCSLFETLCTMTQMLESTITANTDVKQWLLRKLNSFQAKKTDLDNQIKEHEQKNHQEIDERNERKSVLLQQENLNGVKQGNDSLLIKTENLFIDQPKIIQTNKFIPKLNEEEDVQVNIIPKERSGTPEKKLDDDLKSQDKEVQRIMPKMRIIKEKQKSDSSLFIRSFETKFPPLESSWSPSEKLFVNRNIAGVVKFDLQKTEDETNVGHAETKNEHDEKTIEIIRQNNTETKN